MDITQSKYNFFQMFKEQNAVMVFEYSQQNYK